MGAWIWVRCVGGGVGGMRGSFGKGDDLGVRGISQNWILTYKYPKIAPYRPWLFVWGISVTVEDGGFVQSLKYLVPKKISTKTDKAPEFPKSDDGTFKKKTHQSKY